MRPISWIFCLLGLTAALVAPAAAQDKTEEVTVTDTETVTVKESSSTTRSTAGYRASSDDVRPFQTWIEDATIARGIVVEPFFDLADYGPVDEWRLGAQAAFEAAEQFETGLRWSLNDLSSDTFGNSDETGLSDLRAYARYRVRTKNPEIASGLWVDLPVGSSDVGAGNFNVDVFGAMRWHLKGGWVILGNAAIESIETGDDRDTGIQIGGGALYPLSQDLSALGELNWSSARDYGLFSLGLDYRVASSNHMRAAVGFGFDDGGPDVELILGFLMGFN